MAEDGSDYFDLFETGSDTQSGTVSHAENNFDLSQGNGYERVWYISASTDGGVMEHLDDVSFEYDMGATETNSIGPSGVSQSSLTYDNTSIYTQSFSLADSLTTSDPYTDNDFWSISQSDVENGWCTQNAGGDGFADTSLASVWSDGEDIGTYLTPPSFGETIGTYSSWMSSGSYYSGECTSTESGNDTGGYSRHLHTRGERGKREQLRRPAGGAGRLGLLPARGVL